MGRPKNVANKELPKFEKIAEPTREEQQQLKYRQINFYVMRYLWQIICGRQPRGRKTETLYHYIGINKQRYINVLNGYNIRFSARELDDLVINTGISHNIFIGNRRLHIDGVTDKEWDEFCMLRDKRAQEREAHNAMVEKLGAGLVTPEIAEVLEASAEKKTRSEAQIQLESRIKAAIRNQERDDKSNADFFYVCYYMEHKSKYVNPESTLGQVLRLSEALSQTTVYLLEGLEEKELKEYRKTLMEQVKRIDAVQVYRTAKQNKENNQTKG